MRALLFMLLFVASISLAQDPGKPMPPKELSKFLGPVSPKAFTWTKVRGPDFDVFYGHPNPPLIGDVGFYFGGWPSFTPEPGTKIIPGKLGIFPVEWHRAVASDGSVKQEAVIPLDDYWKGRHLGQREAASGRRSPSRSRRAVTDFHQEAEAGRQPMRSNNAMPFRQAQGRKTGDPALSSLRTEDGLPLKIVCP